MKLAENLKKEMKERKITVRQLAEKAGVSHGIISEITTGKVDNPRIMTVINIAYALDVPVVELLGLEEKK